MSISSEQRCPCGKHSRRRRCPDCRDLVIPISTIAEDRQLSKARAEASSTGAKYKTALRQIEQLEREVGIVELLKQPPTLREITAKFASNTSEATAALIASDWHVEERVNAESVNGLNEFNLEIAERRIRKFWRSGERLVRLLKQDVKIPTLLIGLLGDFITGQIHGAENAEMNELLPVDAIVWAQDRIIEGLDFTLDSHKGDIIVVCKVGNHGRTTHQTRLNGEENGHSLEFLMYAHLKAYYRAEKRISFIIDRSYHSFVPVYERELRLHHGHRLRYGGGRGGLFTPTYDAIDNWNKAKRASLDVFGHFHQKRDGGNFLCNGSLIGYNGYAQAIKASFEEPSQTLFLIDKKRGRTCTWPILLES